MQLLEYEDRHKVPPIRLLSLQQSLQLDRDVHSAWRVLSLVAFNHKTNFADENFPKTMKLLEVLPNMPNTFFSVLDPGKVLEGHRGNYQGVLR